MSDVAPIATKIMRRRECSDVPIGDKSWGGLFVDFLKKVVRVNAEGST
jgi:hypothetical protein